MSSGFFGEEIAAKAELCGFPAIAVDGNDVVAVYRVATESIARARRGGGPTLITCKICTESKPGALRGHSGADPVNSHTREAAELWKAGDPIHKMELYLTQKGLFREEWKREIVAAFSRELNAAIEATQKLASS
jgi:pyruvate dehydrogenase E1 component alpha subunit